MDLVSEFQKLLKQKAITMNELSAFLREKQAEYINTQVNQLEENGVDREEARNKASQSWRRYVGGALQGIITGVLQELLEGKGIKLTADKHLLKQKGRNHELDLVRQMLLIDYAGQSNSPAPRRYDDLVRQMLLIDYDEYSFLPDADIILYTYHQIRQQVKILAIISIKNSLRERGFETTYWSVKLKENPTTKDIKFFLATPDVDDEIAYIDGQHSPRKLRVIMEYELDGIYMLRQKDFERTEKVKRFEELFEDILALVEKQAL